MNPLLSTKKSSVKKFRPGLEEPAFRVYHDHSPADVLLVCDHASNQIPQLFQQLGVNEENLRRHIAFDIGAANVATKLADRLHATLITSGFSRLLIDPNRFPEDPNCIPDSSDGTPIPGNRNLSSEDQDYRYQHFFHPYHQAISAQLEHFYSQFIVPIVISIHSFTPVMGGIQRPWHVGVLWDKDNRIASPLLAALRCESGLHVGDNKPYHAKEPVGYTMEWHIERAGLPHALLEIRQDLIADEGGASEWAERLAHAFQPIISNMSLRYHRNTIP